MCAKERSNLPHSFKKSRCDEEQGAVCKQARERSILRNQAGCVLERSSSRMLILAFVPSPWRQRSENNKGNFVTSLLVVFEKFILISIT
ncbi:MAG: hypothetical protein O7C75_04680, partial [Verrucomicrobia bacterium]|nr:hypothetical protein [Verrucomicrobiota bacterium]